MRSIWLLVAAVVSVLIAGCASAVEVEETASVQAAPAINVLPERTALTTSTAATPALPTTAAVVELVEASTPSAPTATATVILNNDSCSPLADHGLADLPGIVSARYTAPPPGREERHHGIDFSYYQNGQRASIAGEVVQSVLGGRVALVLKESFPYGNAVIVESRITDLPESWGGAIAPAWHAYPAGFQEKAPGSVYFLYAHLQETPLVEVDERLNACTPLGAVGKSGNAGVAHLHLEVRLGPSAAQLEDMGYYLYESTPVQREAYLRWRISGEFQHIDPMELLTVK